MGETMADLAEVIANLTRAQRRAVLAGGPKFGRGYWQLYEAMRAKGLVIIAQRQCVLTPLGRAVQDNLAAQNCSAVPTSMKDS